jgi:hypothetical protein
MPTVSADGLRVAFLCNAGSLVGDADGRLHVYLRDIGAGTTVRVSATAAGVAANASSNSATISADGSRVGFLTSATNLVADTLGARQRVLGWRAADRATERADLPAVGGNAEGSASAPSLSADGRRVDRADSHELRASRDRVYRPIEATQSFYALSSDGRWLALETSLGMAIAVPGRPAAATGSDIVLAENPVGDRVFVDGMER